MDIYAKGVIGEAWQYDGDVKSMPDWAKGSLRHHVEVGANGALRYWKGNESIIVDKGDWFVTIHGSTPAEVYSNDAFKQNFTFSDPALRKTDSVFSKKYRSKPTTVLAWQCTGDLHLPELPYWVADLIVHHKLGYHLIENSDEELVQFLYEGVWVPIFKGDWVVRYSEETIALVSDDDFKERFEKIK